MLQPGCEISCGTEPSSLGCLVYSPDGILYAIIAAHASEPSAEVLCKVDDELQSVGRVVKHRTDIDTALVKINLETVNSLTAGDFEVAGIGRPLSRICRLSWYWRRVKAAATDRQRRERARSQIAVQHSGYTSNSIPAPSIDSPYGWVDVGGRALDPTQLNMLHRTTRAGDSGGPVLTFEGELVGFISLGAGRAESSQSTVIAAEVVLDEFGMSLATWNNRESWMGATDPFAGIGWTDTGL